MYCEYWNLNKAPFDNVPDPSMYTDCHESMENVIAETIFAIKEANEAFAVIIGAAGSGKTLALRVIIESLETDKFIIVSISNPEISFTQLLKEIITRLTDTPCEENRKALLLDIFRRLLEKTIENGKKVVIFIDEANSLSPANLESLRLLTNIQDDRTNLFTLVLAGQMELAQRLEHPKRANLFQRIGSYGRIDKLSSPEAVKNYIEGRLKLAGTMIKIFSDESIPIIWEFSEHGIPRLINRICKLSLKAGEMNHLDYISADIVSQIVQRFQKLSKSAVQKRRLRNRPESAETSAYPGNHEEQEEQEEQEEITVHSTRLNACEPQINEQTADRIIPELEKVPNSFLAEMIMNKFDADDYPQKISDEKPIIFISREPDSSLPIEITKENDTADSSAQEKTLRADNPASNEASKYNDATSFIKDLLTEAPASVKAGITAESNPDHHDKSVILPEAKVQDIKTHIPLTEPLQKVAEKTSSQNENDDEMVIAGYTIQLTIPKDILKQVKKFNRESANKSAGFWAAQIIKKNPQLTSSPLADPVYIWNEIKDNILKRIAL